MITRRVSRRGLAAAAATTVVLGVTSGFAAVASADSDHQPAEHINGPFVQVYGPVDPGMGAENAALHNPNGSGPQGRKFK
jgi:hypothetical protein